MGTTLSQLQTGKLNYQSVFAIEGWPTIYTDGSTDGVLAAHGRDWVTAKAGLSYEGTTSQKLDVWNAFTGAGEMTFYIQEPANADDLGVATARSDAGAETFLRSLKIPGTTVVDVASTSAYPASGDFHIGTEAFSYSAKTASQFTGCICGKYAPFGTKTTSNFHHTHRIAGLGGGPQIEPVVSAHHRSWIGRWVGLWVHRITATGIDTRDEAQLVFAGRISSVMDDPNTGCVVIKASHLLDLLPDEVLVKDQFIGIPQEGVYLWEGPVGAHRFKMKDWKQAVSRTANDLVVKIGAAGVNEMEEGYYTLSELASKLNAWLEAETIAGRLWGNYSIATPALTDSGYRTMFNWRINGVAGNTAAFRFSSTSSYPMFFLGLYEFTGTAETEFNSPTRHVNEDWREFSQFAPFTRLIAQNFLISGMGATSAFTVNFETTQGAFVAQEAYLPQEAKTWADGVDPTGLWGLFVIDDIVVAGRYVDADTIANIKALPQLNGTSMPWSNGSTNYGRRAGDDKPLEMKQVFILETSFQQLILSLLLSTGTTDYNDDGNGFDVLGYGLGIGIPYELVGDGFVEDIQNLDEADAPMRVFLDRPTSLKDLINVDMILRTSYFVWKNGHLALTTWVSPTDVVAVHTLTESNKAKPARDEENQNTVSVLTDQFMRNMVKITASRDFRTGTYQDSYTVQDRVSIDDAGGLARVVTLPARNMTSSTVGALIANFIAFVRMFSRPLRTITRSLAPTHYEGTAPGDVAIVSDDNARDPQTGLRGTVQRPGLIIEHTVNWGGWLPSTRSTPEADPLPSVGQAKLMFVETARIVPWSPAAQLDDTADAGGFVSGYNAGTLTLRTYPHRYSGVLTAADATQFAIGDIVDIVQLDPDTTFGPLSWPVRTITNIVGNDITINSALAVPAYDGTKFYVIRPTNYIDTVATQKSKCFLADDGDAMIQDARTPFQFGKNIPTGVGTLVSHVNLPERCAELSFDEGAALDFGHEHGAALMANNLLEHKMALNTPMLEPNAVSGGASAGNYGMALVRRIFIGKDSDPGSGKTRAIELAVCCRSKTGASFNFRTTLSLRPPDESGSTPGLNMTRSLPKLEQIQSTASATFVNLATFTLDCSPFNPANGTAYLMLEIEGDGEAYGFSTVRLKERV